MEGSEIKEKDGLTNQVLVERKKDATTYYLPTYIRFKVKDVDRLDIGSLEGSIEGTMLLTFHYGEIPLSIIEQFVGEDSPKAILLQFNQMEAMELK